MRVRKPKTPHLQPEAVIKVALEILDAEGLENVTLRRIAEKLNVKAPALYWHFKNKRDITEDMAQAILAKVNLDRFNAPANIDEWPLWITDLTHCIRNALIAHKDGGRVVAGASFGRAYNLQKILIHITRVLKQAGFDNLHATLAGATIIDYVWGFVIEEQMGPDQEESKSVFLHKKHNGSYSEDDAFLEEMLEEYHKLSPTEIFDWGLQVIITGLKSTLKKT